MNWNPWWKGERDGSVYLEKFFDRAFLLHRELPNAGKNFIIRGPRQVGKTEFFYKSIPKLIEQGFKPENITYISCDRLGGLGELRNTVRELREVLKPKLGGKILLLDEITGINGWERAVKEFCEEGFFRVWATGSRPKELESKGEYLPGRAELMNFYPLSFREFCISFLRSLLDAEAHLPSWTSKRSEKWKKLATFASHLGITQEVGNRLLQEIRGPNSTPRELAKLYKYFEALSGLFRLYLETGGYPVAIELKILGERPPAELIVKDTLGTIEKEGLNIETLNLVLPELIATMGTRIEYRRLGRRTGIDETTVARYLGTLERSFLLREIYYFDGRVHSRKGKKVYFSDPFIKRALAEYYGLENIDEGRTVEGIVIEAMARKLEDPFRRLWKNRMGFGILRGKEVDLIVGVKGMRRIEVKYEEAPAARKGVDLLLTKDELRVSGKPIALPVCLFLLGT